MAKYQPDIDTLKAMADVLLGAAYADGHHDEDERATVRAILSDVLNRTRLGRRLEAHMEAFDPATFDVREACKRLSLPTPEDRRLILSMIAEVTDADDVHHLDEDAYIRVVAEAIGAARDEFDDLTVDIVSIESVEAAKPLRPPPAPGAPREERAEDT